LKKRPRKYLTVRTLFPNNTLAVLYNPPTMPPELTKAHKKLDKAVEKAYGKTFNDDTARVAYLFELYPKMAGNIFTEIKKKQ
jgi:hypothetical protein